MGYSHGPNGERLYNGKPDRRPERRTIREGSRTASVGYTSGTASGLTRRNSHRALIAGIILAALTLVFVFAHFYDKADKSPQENAIDSYMEQNRAEDPEMQEDDMVSEGGEGNVNQDSTFDQNFGDETETDTSAGVPEELIIEPDDEYEMPDSDSRYLSESDIAGYDLGGIQLIVNEIYARHGRVFERAENYNYFGSKSWYLPVEGKSDEQIVSEFNSYEKANVEFLAQYLN